MTREELSSKGFRPLRPRPDLDALLRVVQLYGYEVETLAGEVWIRKAYRGDGTAHPNAISAGPTVTTADTDFRALSPLILRYRKSGYAEFIERYDTDPAEIRRLIARAEDTSLDKISRCYCLARALTFASPSRLDPLLRFSILPTFFKLDPGGTFQLFLVNEQSEREFGFVRGAYAFDHYPMAEVRAADAGLATLKSWDHATPVDFVDIWLGIVKVATYPRISLFFSGPPGLASVFYFEAPPEHSPRLFPDSWLQWAREDSTFADEERDRRGILEGTNPQAMERLRHRRHVGVDLSRSTVEGLVNWGATRLSEILGELTDVVNFIAPDGYIDLTVPLENALSWLRALRQTLYALTTEEMPRGKFVAFDVADLLDGIAATLRKRQVAETFKLLFNPELGRATVLRALETLPDDLRLPLTSLADDLYQELSQTILNSVWLPGKRLSDGRVMVKRHDLLNEAPEDAASFVATTIRTLRNSHHGYFTTTDDRRSSRYLALVTGNTPSSMATLPLLWIIALLASPSDMVGWEPFGLTSS